MPSGREPRLADLQGVAAMAEGGTQPRHQRLTLVDM